MNFYGTHPVLGLSDRFADPLREEILAAGDRLPKTVTGKIYYLSDRGDDSNLGTSPEQPWHGIEAIKSHMDDFRAGDAILFCRGGIYRGYFEAVSGVYYGAYGQGEKPRIYCSLQNYAQAEWQSVGDNLWQCLDEMPCDAGCVIFDEGDLIGFKKTDRKDLHEDGDFWCDGGKVYLYLNQSPNTYREIEIGTRLTIIGLFHQQHDVTVENLCLRYTGAHGIASISTVKNITVRYCEFGFIGGSYLCNTLRFGNAIEFYGGCENILVEKNWIYQVYDSGFTHQGGDTYSARNLMIRQNLIETCGMGSAEYWLAYADGSYNYAENVTYRENIMRYAGFCWGGVQRPDKVSAHILSNGANQNHFIHYNIIGNIFDQSTHDLLEITSLDETYPKLNGNTYIQTSFQRLGSFGTDRDSVFDSNIHSKLKEKWGDENATVVFADVGEE